MVWEKATPEKRGRAPGVGKKGGREGDENGMEEDKILKTGKGSCHKFGGEEGKKKREGDR